MIITTCNKTGAEKISNAVAQRIIDGKMNHPNGFKTGWFDSEKMSKKIFYRSSYEERAYKILDNDENILSYISEPFRIPYSFNGSYHNYIPDLLIIDSSGKSTVVEIKPSYMQEDEQVAAKARIAQVFCESKNMLYEVWNESTLKVKELKG